MLTKQGNKPCEFSNKKHTEMKRFILPATIALLLLVTAAFVIAAVKSIQYNKETIDLVHGK